MSDIFDQNGPRGERPPGGHSHRSKEELEAENERLREDLLRSREENDLLAELLTGHLEDGTGEVIGGAGESGSHPHERQRFAISEAAIDLFEVLPTSFTLDEALDKAEHLGKPSAEAARHLRSFIAERMVVQDGEQFVKTGSKPYF